MSSTHTLYPPIQPYVTGYLKVSDVHELYYEQSGNEKGNPVVVLHGGRSFQKDEPDFPIITKLTIKGLEVVAMNGIVNSSTPKFIE